MGLAQEIQRDFELWRAVGRSDPVLTGFVWEGNVLQCLPEAMWVGRAWLPAPLPQGLRMECFPLFPPWFSRLQNEYSDSCLLEEKRGSWMVFPDMWSSLKNIIHTESSSEAALSSSTWGSFWTHALRTFFSSPVCFVSQRTGLLETGRFPGDLPKVETYFAAKWHLSFLAWSCRSRGVPRVQVGFSRERGGDVPVVESSLGATIHHVFVCIILVLVAKDESRAGFLGRTSQAECILLALFPKSLCRAARAGSLFSIKG